MTKNITLRLEEAVLRKAKQTALQHDQSLSKWVAGLIVQIVSAPDIFHATKQRVLRRLETGFHLSGAPMRRDQLHER